MLIMNIYIFSNLKNKTNCGVFANSVPVRSLKAISKISCVGLPIKLTGGLVLKSAFNLA
jgi:hypothetical protein